MKYDPAEQLKVYGGKHPVPSQRPVVELGYPLYDAGALPEGMSFPFGQKDLSRPELLVYGDWRTAIAWNDLGKTSTAQLATRINLDVNLQLTGTERFHMFFQPLQQNGQFTHFQFAGNNGPNKFNNDLNVNPVTVFFEGDAGAILAGWTDEYKSFDLPFGVGKMPLFFQNGIWFNDAPIGGAFTIPAKNSPMLDISNMDVTFFGEADNVASNAIRSPSGALDIHAARLYGFHTEIERHEGYIEFGYGYTDDTRPNSGFSYHNVTAAFTKRYWYAVSNSIRFIGNFGQHPDNGAPKTADGYVFLVENSLITSLPSTFVPYFNGWFGHHRPQALARDPGTGGILLNTGINFETDGLTGFPNSTTAPTTPGAARSGWNICSASNSRSSARSRQCSRRAAPSAGSPRARNMRLGCAIRSRSPSASSSAPTACGRAASTTRTSPASAPSSAGNSRRAAALSRPPSEPTSGAELHSGKADDAVGMRRRNR